MLVRRRGLGSKTVVSVAVLIGLVAGPAFAAVDIETMPVGDPGNAADTPQHSGNPAGQGSVAYAYRIGKYEVTQGQYTEFLNQVAATDTYGLYNAAMVDAYYRSAIHRSGAPGSYTYNVDPVFVDRPVNYVTYWNACRFANWLSNGRPAGAQDAGTTERGTYTLDGYTGHDGRTIQRTPDATWAVPSEDEWYKAAYYKGGSADAGYWHYPTRSNARPGRDLADASGNNANYGVYGLNPIAPPYYTTMVGEFQSSTSPYGTFDQGGNVQEWNEAIAYRQYEGETSVLRGMRGGSYAVTCGDDGDATLVLRASFRGGNTPDYKWGPHIGFRVVELPDCNHNRIADSQDIASGTSQDCNLNHIPDECDPDTDHDGLIDGCDPDGDNDGIPDDGDGSGLVGDHPCTGGNSVNCDDNCRWVANTDQFDLDADGFGDVCDRCPDNAIGAVVDATGCPLPVPGDFDGDGDIDQEDFGLLQRCMTGCSAPITAPECQRANLDHDADVDEFDVDRFFHCYTGPGFVGNPHCAD